jgi:hypothetical protein
MEKQRDKAAKRLERKHARQSDAPDASPEPAEENKAPEESST